MYFAHINDHEEIARLPQITNGAGILETRLQKKSACCVLLLHHLQSCHIQLGLGLWSYIQPRPQGSFGGALEVPPGSVLLRSKASLDELFLDFRQGARKLRKAPTIPNESSHPGNVPSPVWT